MQQNPHADKDQIQTTRVFHGYPAFRSLKPVSASP